MSKALQELELGERLLRREIGRFVHWLLVSSSDYSSYDG